MSESFKVDVNLSQEDWFKYLQDYEKSIFQLSVRKKKPELVELDHLYRSKLKDAAKDRCPLFIELEELSNIMRWKLLRGKMRPLQKLVDSNSNGIVIAASSKAFKELSLHNWKGAMDALCTLKGGSTYCICYYDYTDASLFLLVGVGVATASAVLSSFAPESVPFMADEAINAVKNLKRDYNMKTYMSLRNSLISKAEELGDDWNAELVGRALWVRAMTLNESKVIDKYIEITESDPQCAKNLSSIAAVSKRQRKI